MLGVLMKEVSIDETTKIPLFAVLSIVPVIVGFIFWLTVIHLTAQAAERQNEKQDIKIESQYQILLEIRDRLIKIESNQIKQKGES
jgi:large-conductance mechanosensitive channel